MEGFAGICGAQLKFGANGLTCSGMRGRKQEENRGPRNLPSVSPSVCLLS